MQKNFLLESDNGASPFPSLLLLAPYFLLLARCLALPAKAFLRQFQIRGANEGVESALVDNHHLLCSTGGSHFVHPSVVRVHVNANCLAGIAVPQRLPFPENK